MHIAHTVGAQLATLTTTELLLEEQNYKNGVIWVYSVFKSFVFNIVLKCVGGRIGQQCEKLVLLGTTASLASTHPPHTFIHHLINPISLVITHTFNPFLIRCLLPLHSFHFYNHPNPSLCLTRIPSPPPFPPSPCPPPVSQSRPAMQ